MAHSIDKYRKFEDCLVEESALKYMQFHHSETISEKKLNSIFRDVHENVILNLISHYIFQRCKDLDWSDFGKFFLGMISKSKCIIEDVAYSEIPLLCESLHIGYLNSMFIFNNGSIIRKTSKANLIENGAVYTLDEIAYDIVKNTLLNVIIEKPHQIKVLDFASGTGRFYRQIAKCLEEIWGISPSSSVLNNIYAVDIDPIAVNICRLFALDLTDNISISTLSVISEHIICKNALVKKQFFEEDAITSNDCDGLFFGGFDAIVSNPPYLVLKPNSRKMDKGTVDNINRIIRYFRNSPDYVYSIEGMLNLYQLSLEAMLGMLNTGGEMGIICPSTLFADISATKLRKYLLSKHGITYIKYFTENDPLFFNVTQATCIFHLTKNATTTSIKIEQGNKIYQISLSEIKLLFKSNWEIPSIEKIEWDILNKLNSFETIKISAFIRNKRGELDLTLHKDYITTTPTQHRLVRGNMLTSQGIKNMNNEFVTDDFLNVKSNEYLTYDYGRRRLVCQQISNQLQKKRFKFCICEPSDILGNSCNYLTVPDGQIEQIKVLLNSALLNWRFKITSTNNHINNYELDELPMLSLDIIERELIHLDVDDLEMNICKLFGLNETETSYILSKYEAI